MKVIMVAIGSVGDVNPIVGIGAALKKRGHSVVILTSSYFESTVAQANLDFHSIGSASDYRKALDQMNITVPFRLRSIICDFLYLRPMRPVYEYIRTHYYHGNTVVVCSLSSLGSRLANEKLGVPLVSINLAPMMSISTTSPPRLMPWENPRWIPQWGHRALFHLVEHRFDREICSALNEFRKEIGLPPQHHILQWVGSPGKIINMFPDWFAPPQLDWPAQTELTGFPLFDEIKDSDFLLPSKIDSFLNLGTPPILFTPGTPNKKASAFFQAALDATIALKMRAIFLTKHREQVPPDLPPEVLFIEYIPFSRIFPRAALIVHHGGIGTLAQALKAGLPQLIVPWGLDQYDNASRIKTLGVGDELSKKYCKSTSLAGKLEDILNSHFIDRKCKYYADKFREGDPIEDTCRIIETYVCKKSKRR